VTARHLAKNIGLKVCKPDRHLCRLAIFLGEDSPESLCGRIGQIVAERIDVVDSVLWRFAILDSTGGVAH
jgi:hypothetical protein